MKQPSAELDAPAVIITDADRDIRGRLLATLSDPNRRAQLPPENRDPEGPGFQLMIERLASNPAVDVGKFERLLDMQVKLQAMNAKAEFDAAFAEMQGDIPEIDEKGRLLNKAGQLQSTYARNEDIQRVLRPILKRYGMALRFRTEWPEPGIVVVIGILAHRGGHHEESEFRSPADTSGNKNAIQALASTVSYGHRYTTCDLLNITSRLADNDGATHRGPQPEAVDGAPQPPEGYDDWKHDMTAVADNGTEAFVKAWQDSKGSKNVYRLWSAQHDKAWGAAIKNKAREVTRAAEAKAGDDAPAKEPETAKVEPAKDRATLKRELEQATAAIVGKKGGPKA